VEGDCKLAIGIDVDMGEIDVPAVLAFRVSAAGELGHGALKRGRPGHGKPLQIAAHVAPGTTGGLQPPLCPRRATIRAPSGIRPQTMLANDFRLKTIVLLRPVHPHFSCSNGSRSGLEWSLGIECDQGKLKMSCYVMLEFTAKPGTDPAALEALSCLLGGKPDKGRLRKHSADGQPRRPQ
jgi:hypothetical protein